MEPFSRLSRLKAAVGSARHQESSRGFTLIEMLIVLAIIMVLAVIALTSQTSFNRTFLLSNTAYDVALTMRNAQYYGVGGRTIGVSNVGYGLDFQIGSPTTFTLFGDSSPTSGPDLCHSQAGLVGGANSPAAQSGDCRYSVGQDVQAASYTIGNGVLVTDLCVEPVGSSAWLCASSHDFSQLDIVFARPSTNTFMTAGTSGSTWLCSSGDGAAFCSTGQNIMKACIMLGVNGAQKVVEVNSVGEITVNGDSCI